MQTQDTKEQAKGPGMSAVIPARDAEATLGQCLDALLAAGMAARSIVVVDDGSKDATARIARAAGVTVVASPAPVRPAAARNLGAAHVTDELIMFVDADVAVHTDAVARLRATFAADDVVAVFGSYDDAPPAVSVVSRYRNLLHHYVHQTAPTDARTFWTGLGAVRASAFRDVEGFDTEFDYLEDVDLGLRLQAVGGRIALDAGIQGTHLKIWTLRSMLHTDLWARALPWMGLMRSGRMSPTELNGGWSHRVSAACVALAILALCLAPFWPPALLLIVLALAVFVAANIGFLRCLARVGGAGFAIRALPYHAAHYLAALAGYVIDRLQASRTARRARDRA
jgi:hypothetical protein